MSSSANSLSNVYLDRENNELVVREGVNPNESKFSDKRVLIVGGGVTGLTVRVYLMAFAFTLSQLFRTRGHSWTLATQSPLCPTAGPLWRTASPLKLPAHCK